MKSSFVALAALATLAVVANANTPPPTPPGIRAPEDTAYIDDPVPEECTNALVAGNFDFYEGQGGLCYNCLRQSSIYEDVTGGQIDGFIENGTLAENLDKFFMTSKLKACCGLGCGKWWKSLEDILVDSCNATLYSSGPLIPSKVIGAVGDLFINECSTIKDWAYNPLCAPRREDSAAGENNEVRVCSVHNDPHVKPFEGSDQVTCNSTGTMLLHENDYLDITAEAEAVSVTGASILTSVTIKYKSANCSTFGSSDEKTIDANTAFVNGMYTFVEPRLWTSISIRKYSLSSASGGIYLSVRINSPYYKGSGVCVDGCPAGESVDVSALFGKRRSLLVTEAEAETACKAAGVEGDFLTSCKFDVIATEDTTAFTASASTAADDYTAGVKEAEEDNTAFNIELNGPAPPPPTKSPDPISPDGAYTALPSKALLLAVVAGLLLLGLQLA